MSYKITIVQTVDEEYYDKGEWKKTSTLWISQEKYGDIHDWKEQSEWKFDKESGQYCKECYEYVGGGNMIRKKDIEIYEQRIENLDVKGVIGAVLAGI